MSFAIAGHFDTENRQIVLVQLEIDDVTNDVIKVCNEDVLSKSEWADMDEDAWLREIPVIQAEFEAKGLLAKVML